MKRKVTQLEHNLISRGYHLSHKTYTGKNSDKVDTYIYIKDKNNINYYVALDKNRNEIVHYSFTNNYNMYYSNGTLESLLEINARFNLELQEIYDFGKKESIEINEPFIEESSFDD